jgi:hypothetical protein
MTDEELDELLVRVLREHGREPSRARTLARLNLPPTGGLSFSDAHLVLHYCHGVYLEDWRLLEALHRLEDGGRVASLDTIYVRWVPDGLMGRRLEREPQLRYHAVG